MNGTPILHVRDLSKTFDHVRVLDQMSLDVNELDGVVAITGPNAAGKTTLFNIITGVERPDSKPSATVKVFGHLVTKLQSWEIAQLGVTRLFQDARAFLGLTLMQNVQVAGNGKASSSWWSLLSRPQGDRISLDALDFVGLADRRDQPASVLSLGDRRKLAIACMLRTGARLLLLDEPTANLDAQTTEQMKQLVRDLAREKKSIVLIEHNQEFVQDVADNIFTIHQGRCRRNPSVTGSKLPASGGQS